MDRHQDTIQDTDKRLAMLAFGPSTLVSIIINNYNYGRFVGDAIESALNQDHQNVEVIIVDDGSTDNSRDIIESFHGKVTALFKENGGQGSALNAGYGRSHGELILFLDSDDVLCSTAVSEIVDNFNCGMSKLHFRLKTMDEAGKLLGSEEPVGSLDRGDLISQMLHKGTYSFAPMSGNAFSRLFLSKIMPMPEGPWAGHADCYLLYSAPFFGPVGAVDRCLGRYRIHSSTISLGSLSINGKVSLQRLRFQMQLDREKAALTEACSRRFGLKPLRRRMDATLHDFKLRLASIRLESHTHPVQGDSRTSLALAIIKCALTSTDLNIGKKVAAALWAVATALAPSAILHTAILCGIKPSARPAILARLLGVNGPESSNKR